MAAYDTFDYPSYWIGRDYEHQAEVFALTKLIGKIKKLSNILEIGAGFGRLAPSYIFRAKRVILSDPSAKLLAIAKKEIGYKNISFLKSNIEKLPEKLKSKSVDLIIMVRVLHHITNYDRSIKIVNRILKKNGYLILEFPNKLHLKAAVTEFFKGNLTFFLDIFPKDIRSKKSKEENTLPFLNFHPDIIRNTLTTNGFKIIEERSVSNIRSVFIKKILPSDTLIFIEKFLQVPFSRLNFGPSIFILAKKEY